MKKTLTKAPLSEHRTYRTLNPTVVTGRWIGAASQPFLPYVFFKPLGPIVSHMNLRVLIPLLTLAGCTPAMRQLYGLPSNEFDLSKGYSTLYKCDYEAMKAEWAASRYGPIAQKDDMCTILGRYGEPSRFSTSDNENYTFLTLTWVLTNSRVVTVLTQWTKDTPFMRQYQPSKVGRWSILNVST